MSKQGPDYQLKYSNSLYFSSLTEAVSLITRLHRLDDFTRFAVLAAKAQHPKHIDRLGYCRPSRHHLFRGKADDLL